MRNRPMLTTSSSPVKTTSPSLCTSYLTFRSTPVYNNPATISYLLAADAYQIAAANKISDVGSIPDDTLLIIPVNCSCSGGNYYQHNASYVLKETGESYFTVANYTYQAHSTCQSMMAQNRLHERQLSVNDRVKVPLRCACPTPKQIAGGFRYLLTYLIRQGNDIPTIAQTFFGAGPSIIEANELSDSQFIFYFTPILVPLKLALRQINHFHIIRLSGFCLYEGVTYFVYEYAIHGSRCNWLQRKENPIDEKYKSSGDKDYSKLDWKQRVRIACDVADAWNYFHNFTNPPYIHKNLNSSNILLDDNMRAKVTNFGFAKKLDDTDQPIITRHVVGTYGFMAPEYLENGLVTPKLDVFAIGILILELLSGREPITNAIDEKGDQILISDSIRELLGGKKVRYKLRGFIDPRLGEEYPLDLAYSMAQLAKNCVAHDLNDRPTVAKILMILSKIFSLSLDWDPSHELQNSVSLSLG